MKRELKVKSRPRVNLKALGSRVRPYEEGTESNSSFNPSHWPTRSRVRPYEEGTESRDQFRPSAKKPDEAEFVPMKRELKGNI